MKSLRGPSSRRFHKQRAQRRLSSPDYNPITDHALLRYIQRHLGYEVEELREALATKELRLAAELGAGSFKVDGGEFRFNSKGMVITFIED